MRRSAIKANPTGPWGWDTLPPDLSKQADATVRSPLT
jgi:hypothetical protein